MVGGEVVVGDGFWVLAERLSLEVVVGAVGGGRSRADRCEEREDDGDGLGEHGDKSRVLLKARETRGFAM